MTEHASPYPTAFDNLLIDNLDRRNFYGNDSAIRAAPVLLSPPHSRGSSPPATPGPVQHEIQTRQMDKKTSDFFANPFDRQLFSPPPSIRRQTAPMPSSSDSPITDAFFANPFRHYEEKLPSRESSPPRPAQTANEAFFFGRKSPTPMSPPSERSTNSDTSIRVPPLERFFPSRATLQSPIQSVETGHQPRSPSRMRDVVVDSPSEIVASQPITIDTENTSGLTSQLSVFVILDELPSTVPSPVASSPATPVLTSSPASPTTPDSPTPTAELPEPVSYNTATSKEFFEGDTVGPVQLVHLLGQGAFSSVWLARDIDHIVENGGGKQGSKRLRDSTAQKSKRGDRTSHGLRPPPATTSLSGSTLVRGQSVYFAAKDATKGTGKTGDQANLIAVKMMDRAFCDTDDRTRVSFVREVEVLRHISHPSIVSYLHHFSTPTHHCLVLEALQGGELFDLIGQKDNHARMTQSLTRRIFGELCHAVGWIHSVGLVHRDVKLENILFTINPFLLSSPALTVPPLSQPLIKLTDFGLARFIDPAAPLLTTRCGSEFYAAPEIILGRAYDGRQTDSWACGVVLYALATGTLPFDQHILGRTDTRRGYLMRIARGEYFWPQGAEAHLANDGLKKVVGRLLVRDPTKRSRVEDIWDEEWMRGDGAPASPIEELGHLTGDEIPKVAREEMV